MQGIPGIGLVGIQGIQGNPGPDGHTGGVGVQGAQGQPGKAGQTGPAGAAGADSLELTDRRLVFLVALLAFVMTLFGGLILHNTAGITSASHRLAHQQWVDQQNTYQTCLTRSGITEHNNATFDKLADIERDNRFIDENIRQRRVSVYAQAKSTPVDCSKMPHGQPDPKQ